jgi:hypothetical protein
VSNSTFNWAFSSGGHFVAGTDNAYDIGSSGASRPRRFFLGGGSLTGTEADSSLTISPTWNTTGTPTAVLLNVTDTASNANSLLMDLQVGGSSRFRVDKAGVATITQSGYVATIAQNSLFSKSGNSKVGIFLTPSTTAINLANDSEFGWSPNASVNSVTDTILARDAANTLAQRNGTNAQTFRVYNTFTDASNYERGRIAWVSGQLLIGTEAAGTGSNRTVRLLASDGSSFNVGGGLAATGGLTFTVDNVYDIGASGATRPRAIYTGGLVSVGGLITQKGRFAIDAPTDGVAVLYNNAQTDFGRLQFGGTTSSFPALKRNATALETKLADDSAYAPHAMQYLDVTDGVTAPGAAAGRARIYVDTADGDLKVVFADGTVKTIVTDT